MPKTKSRSSKSNRNKRPSGNSRSLTKNSIKKYRPLHKRFLLHPVSIFLLLCIGVLIIGLTARSTADNYVVSAVVPAQALQQPAVITYPTNGSSFTVSPITVRGTCPLNSYVKLFRNGYFSGVANCSASQTFQIQTDLTIGINKLSVQDYNITNSPGPTSPGVTVYYNPTASNNSQTVEAANTPSGQSNGASDNSVNGPLLLTSSFNYATMRVDQRYSWPVNISGGVPTYVILVHWGDNTTSTMYIKSPSGFNIEHVYTRAGTYNIIVEAVDTKGVKALLQLSIVVNPHHQIGIFGTNGNTGNDFDLFSWLENWLWIIWPTYITVLLMIISFWLGERREYDIIFKRRKAHR